MSMFPIILLSVASLFNTAMIMWLALGKRR